MTFALVMAFGMNFIAYWFSDRIVLRMYRAQPVTEEEAPELLAMVRRLALQAELPMPAAPELPEILNILQVP